MKYMVDIDGTICDTVNKDYEKATPIEDRITKLNWLYDQGHEIHYWTARGTTSGKDWKELTERQLNEWGCKYHSVKLGKPDYDMWIDDKARAAEVFFRTYVLYKNYTGKRDKNE